MQIFHTNEEPSSYIRGLTCLFYIFNYSQLCRVHMHVHENWKAISVRIILSLTVKLRVCTHERLNIPSCKILFLFISICAPNCRCKNIHISAARFLQHTWLKMHVHVSLCFACVSKSLQPHSPDLPMTTVSHFFFLVYRIKHTKKPLHKDDFCVIPHK